MQKPSERWPTPQELTDLVTEIRRVAVEETERIFLLSVQVKSILENRATYADTLAVFASFINMMQADDDMARGVCVLALGASCGVPVKNVDEDGFVNDVYTPPPPAAPPKPTPARGHLRLVRSEDS